MSEYKKGDRVLVYGDSAFFEDGEVATVVRQGGPGTVWCAHENGREDPVDMSRLTPCAEADSVAEDTADFERVAAEQDRVEEAGAERKVGMPPEMAAPYGEPPVQSALNSVRQLHEGVGTQSHYMECAIQPIDFIVENRLDFLEGNVIKYVARYKRKNGLEDLKKAQQYLTWLIEREERKDAEQ